MIQFDNIDDIKKICIIDNYICENEHTNICNNCLFVRLSHKFSLQFKKSHHIDDIYVCSSCFNIFHFAEIYFDHVTMFNTIKTTFRLSPCCKSDILTLKSVLYTRW